MFDLTIKTPARIIIVGPSQSGKTHRVFQFLRYREFLFDKPECAEPSRVYCFYKIWTDVFEDNKDLVHNWIQKFPSHSDLEQIGTLFKDIGGCTVIIDDWEGKLDLGIADFFKNLSHHLNITTFLILQSLFPSRRESKNISLQASHIAIFQNNRDRRQFDTFARQLHPRNNKHISRAYYLLFQP